jgi:hypothetical protein
MMHPFLLLTIFFARLFKLMSSSIPLSIQYFTSYSYFINANIQAILAELHYILQFLGFSVHYYLLGTIFLLLD